MKNASFTEKLGCILFFGALALTSTMYLLSGGKEYSALEKRYLAPAPTLSAESLFSGSFADETESFMADHMPARDALVGAVAYYDLLSGRQNTKEILRGADGRLFERPTVWDGRKAEENIAAIRAFGEKTGLRADLMLVPSAGYVLRGDVPGLHDKYEDGEHIARCYAMAQGDIGCIDLTGPFCAAEDKEELYYSTDHHWTSRGAWTAGGIYLQSKGRAISPQESYKITVSPLFHGSTYARSALWLTPGEDVQLWDCGGDFTVRNSESDEEHDGLFYTERLAEDDRYTVFLDGNHALVRIENGDPRAEGKLLVIRDSFSNCLGGFLAEGYKTVVLADLRYYKLPLSELCAQEGFDDVLVVCSLGNFLGESGLEWLD